jgi:hypothetical protein
MFAEPFRQSLQNEVNLAVTLSVTNAASITKKSKDLNFEEAGEWRTGELVIELNAVLPGA